MTSEPQSSDPFGVEINNGYTVIQPVYLEASGSAPQVHTIGELISVLQQSHPILDPSTTKAFVINLHEIHVWGSPGGVISLVPNELINTGTTNPLRKQLVDNGNGVTRPHLVYQYAEAEQTVGTYATTSDAKTFATTQATAGLNPAVLPIMYVKCTIRANSIINIAPAALSKAYKPTVKRELEDVDTMSKVKRVKEMTLPIMQ
uniref:Uncharacterized protein n=1 Tax=Tarsiger cyanurus CRESS-DNA-virus sp. TaxID=2815060 RepID=A0A8A4XD22_9VIRU|nr:MAG: hypothetical protein [Tarsiger cyanurus CRESS-DNA-virus sp.]